MIKQFLLAAALGLSIATNAVAQPQVMRIVVTFAPGGPVELVARIMAERLGKELGRTVIVENKPGANGAIGAVSVVRSPPDGNTVWLTSVGAAAINPALYKSLPYDMQRDFAPVAVVVNNVELLVANQDEPSKDAAEFVAATKSRPNPTAIASSGIGSIPHLAIEQLKDATGAKLLHVPYKGGALAITDLMGGQVRGFFGDVPGLLNYVQGGRLKALGVASPKRLPSLPDVKTLEEQGIKGVDTNNWYAMFAPAKTPAAVVDALNKAVRNTLADPQVREKLLKAGTEPAPSTPQALAALLKHDTDKWAKLIQDKNIRIDQ